MTVLAERPTSRDKVCLVVPESPQVLKEGQVVDIPVLASKEAHGMWVQDGGVPGVTVVEGPVTPGQESYRCRG